MTIRVAAEAACFRQPEFTEDLVSYDVMPPTVARGLLGSLINAKGSWTVNRIGVCKPIEFATLELDTDRGQRRCLALHRVEYLIDARWQAAEGFVGAADDLLDDAFRTVGNSLHLGVHSHRATVSRCSPQDWAQVIECDRELGWMVYDLGGVRHARARYFRARLTEGILDLSAPLAGDELFS